MENPKEKSQLRRYLEFFIFLLLVVVVGQVLAGFLYSDPSEAIYITENFGFSPALNPWFFGFYIAANIFLLALVLFFAKYTCLWILKQRLGFYAIGVLLMTTGFGMMGVGLFTEPQYGDSVVGHVLFFVIVGLLIAVFGGFMIYKIYLNRKK